MSAADHHTLASASTTVQIPRGMIWTDEFSWTAVEAVSEYGIGGALIVDAATKLDGRPITLEAEDDAGHIERSVLLQVMALADVPLGIFTLTLADGRVFSVMFAPGEPVSARLAVGRPEVPVTSTRYAATFRFVTALPGEEEEPEE